MTPLEYHIVYYSTTNDIVNDLQMPKLSYQVDGKGSDNPC